MTTKSENLVPDRLADGGAMFRRLRELKASLPRGVNKHEQAIVLITAAIEEGVNTRLRIGKVLECIGLDRAHVMIILNEGAGTDPNRHRWSRDENGIYYPLGE